METEYWLKRWREGRTGWHRSEVMPLLVQHWAALDAPRGSRVLVPLCGKSLDMPWLASQGLRVRGVELAAQAVEDFFAEHPLSPQTRELPYGTHYDAGEIKIINADIFEVNAAQFANCGAIYDRAALIALPPPMRERYVADVHAKLPSGCRGLLVTLEYPQVEKAGPPFSVQADEVAGRFGHGWVVDLLERRDILAAQPGFVAEGVTSLHTSAWRLLRR